MMNYKAIPGFTGSEIERASLSCGAFPAESILERQIKRKLARGLTRVARLIDPSVVIRIETRTADAH